MYPFFPVESASFTWLRACVTCDRETTRWLYSRTGNRPAVGPVRLPGPDFLLKDGHFASVDAVHIARTFGQGKLVFSGSRDLNLSVWDLNRMPFGTVGI